ncbi:hypothetical protein NHX12_025888 [Muraenolepis orangiensis]|uniref:Uncharacterized protein n=1 Tax=Muraenolepis orangiensis TaxID=630683 RepID=A0A9Q0EE25_9TELE|nr:hypothetical protein NHX12_025888 [Muraenolepis orangiensis]
MHGPNRPWEEERRGRKPEYIRGIRHRAGVGGVGGDGGESDCSGSPVCSSWRNTDTGGDGMAPRGGGEHQEESDTERDSSEHDA